ncbi:MAG: hypothetical protein FWF92_09305 [Oscillospiraceae bacterium]|nr:hypothetical protein [Oscillospiraceae bacterium]
MNNNINNNPEKENEKNEKTERKMAEVEKKSALPILSVGITWIVLAVFCGRIIKPTTFVVAACILSYIVYHIIKKNFPPKKIEIIMEPEKPKAPPKPEKKEAVAKAVPQLSPEELALKDLNERINLYFIEIKLLNDSIGDEFISNELNEIENSLKKIQVQLNDAETKKSQTKKVEQLTQFFDYYMPTTIKILNSYRRIENRNLTGENAMETKKRVEESLPFVRKAFEKELDNMFSDEMLDITTDIDVLESVLSKEGLIDKNTIGGIRNIQGDIKNDFFNGQD